MFSTKVPGSLGFIFDIVVVHINLTNKNIEEISKLKIDVKFIKNNLQITSSRINVAEFKAERGLEFIERTSVLKEQLYKYPLECQVFYDGLAVGTCNFLWPDSFINCIAGGCGRELTHCEEADIKNGNDNVGSMEIIVRLQIKCDEFEINQMQEPKSVNLCNQTNNVINLNDVLFMVGEDREGSIACADVDIIPTSETGSSANATCLDLSHFRHINGKTVLNTDILDNMNMSCCKSKKSVNQCQQIIDNLLNKSKDSKGSPDCSKKSQEPSKTLPYKSLECMSDSRFASCSSSGKNTCNIGSQKHFSSCRFHKKE